MLELLRSEENDSSPESVPIETLKSVTFIGLLNTFDYTRSLLSTLRESESIDILTVREDMTKAKSLLRLLYLKITAILHSYQDGFTIEEGTMKCDFCTSKAFKYKDFHKWCEDCFIHEYGGDEK